MNVYANYGNKQNEKNDEIKQNENLNDEQNVFRILIVSDNHLGFKEDDAIRSNDSFETFEEILNIAKNEKVDFVLHSGDLFDQQKPSRNTMYKTMNILRENIYGDEKIKFEILNDQKYFKFGVNFENENANISIPIFIIHGNHDDPGGESRLSPIDVLEVSNLVNYFGRTEDLEEIFISPILMKKGNTNISIYGLGWVKDERLHRAFQNKKVKFLVPEGDESESRFNIFLIHQNRYKGNASGSIPIKNNICDKMLPNFLDLVIWGHEHECLIDGFECLESLFHIIQPGSSVHTSLSSGESLPKHIAILEIKGDNFRILPIELLSVRPFEFDDLCLSEANLQSNDEKDIWNFLTESVENLISRARRSFEKKKSQNLNANIQNKLPLIRLRVEHSGFNTISNWRFANQFVDKVANATEILHFYKKKKFERRGLGANSSIPEIEIEDVHGGDEDDEDIHDLIFHYMDEKNALNILPEPDLNIAVQDFVIKMESNAINDFVNRSIKEAQKDIITLTKEGRETFASATDINDAIKKRTAAIRGIRLNQLEEEGMVDMQRTTSDKNENENEFEDFHFSKNIYENVNEKQKEKWGEEENENSKKKKHRIQNKQKKKQFVIV